MVAAVEPILNQLANPFFKAQSDKAWRNLVRETGPQMEGIPWCDFKFLQRGVEEIVASREYNQFYGEFRKRH